jgi:Cu-Zn family superoxide dismutase
VLASLASGCGRREATDERPPGIDNREGSAAPETPRPGAAPTSSGKATLEGRSGNAMTGQAVFTPAPDRGVVLVVDVQGAPPGLHAIHLHEIGDCSAPDAASAGDHYNPTGHKHGDPKATEHHAGDFGNLEVVADGTGHLEIQLPDLTIEQVRDRALVIHARPDDMSTQPSGNSGDRIGCGVVSVVVEDATSPPPGTPGSPGR